MIGASALGLVACVTLVFCASIALTKAGSGEEFGSAIYLALFAFGGGIFGAIAGFVGSLRWISERGSEPWTPSTWIGVMMGIVIGLLVRSSGALNFLMLEDLTKWWSGFAVFLTAAACLGGFLGSFAWPVFATSSRRTSK